MRILICEDDPDIQEILHSFLVAEGYEVSSVGTGEEALTLFSAEEPDLVLLDVLLPGKDGWDVLREIRRQSDTPVIMLTALGRVSDKVKALSELAADDYITKASFDLAEVKARIEAVMRRYQPHLAAAKVVIDDVRKEVWIRGSAVFLTPKEYNLLELLASEPGRVFSTEEILAHLWQESVYASAQDVQKYIYLLRKKIEEDHTDPKLVLTARGFGYRMAT
ncbi:response regulator transcription factor [Candidatus Bipolaricaulota bacterium]|nr:response regulator transcription factor [Candidatus Bipolaricaulota bacterium]